jgi:hypothetical protein
MSLGSQQKSADARYFLYIVNDSSKIVVYITGRIGDVIASFITVSAFARGHGKTYIRKNPYQDSLISFQAWRFPNYPSLVSLFSRTL